MKPSVVKDFWQRAAVLEGNRGYSLTDVTSASSAKCLQELISLSNKMGRPVGCRLHTVSAEEEEVRPCASLISDYDCGVFNSGRTAISQPRGRGIIVFSK